MRKGLLVLLSVLLLVLSSSLAMALPQGQEHPRLFFTQTELVSLRKAKSIGVHGRIYRNIIASADWCMKLEPRKEWIAPVTPDPIYANLYDRFYGMMQDTSVVDKLAFAYAYSGDKRYFTPAHDWLLAVARTWRREADGAPDASKAYAVMRVLRGISVSYDILYNDLTPAERTEVGSIIAGIAGKYYQWYLDNPTMGTVAGQGSHHASVEVPALGLAALTLLGEYKEAEDWLKLARSRFEGDLLPNALTPNGVQTEGENYYASVMFCRLFFMDALRRVTGVDLFDPFEKQMSGVYALSMVAGEKKERGYDEGNKSVMFSSEIAQINFNAPVLIKLASEYKNTTYQCLALWDRTLGDIQKTRYISPAGEWLLFDHGGYCYAWYDPSVKATPDPSSPLSFDFPEVDKFTVRDSYKVKGVCVGTRNGCLEAHAGGWPVFIEHEESMVTQKPVAERKLQDDGKVATITITCGESEKPGFSSQSVVLNRSEKKVVIRRETQQPLKFWYHGSPRVEGRMFRWGKDARLTIKAGEVVSIDPKGYRESRVVGLGKLPLKDPLDVAYPVAEVKPENGEIVIEITARK